MTTQLNDGNNEIKLVMRARQDIESFGILYDLYFPRVYKYVVYRVFDYAAADDIVSEIFERVLANLSKYDERKAPFGAWVFAISRHAILDHLRRRKAHPLLALDSLARRADPGSNTEQATLEHDRNNSLRAAIHTLSAQEIDLIGLKYSFGLTNRQIASALGKNANNVGVMLHRAINKLRGALAGEEEDDE